VEPVLVDPASKIHVADPRRWWMLPVILIGSFLSFLDFFIVNIALPAMRTDLHATPAELQFIVALMASASL
jgi:MFS family permease